MIEFDMARHLGGWVGRRVNIALNGRWFHDPKANLKRMAMVGGAVIGTAIYASYQEFVLHPQAGMEHPAVTIGVPVAIGALEIMRQGVLAWNKYRLYVAPEQETPGKIWDENTRIRRKNMRKYHPEITAAEIEADLKLTFGTRAEFIRDYIGEPASYTRTLPTIAGTLEAHQWLVADIRTRLKNKYNFSDDEVEAYIKRDFGDVDTAIYHAFNKRQAENDKWYEYERKYLEKMLRAGDIDQTTLDARLDKLNQVHDEIKLETPPPAPETDTEDQVDSYTE